jgi:Fe-S cluster biogenesis protein NfuA
MLIMNVPLPNALLHLNSLQTMQRNIAGRRYHKIAAARQIIISSVSSSASTATTTTAQSLHLPRWHPRRPITTTAISPSFALPSTSFSSSNPSWPGSHRHLQIQQLLTHQRRSLFIQTATTPNPESLKFIPNGRLVLGHNNPDKSIIDNSDPNVGEIEIPHREEEYNNSNSNNGVHLTRKDHLLIARSPLAKSLFHLDEGIKSIYLGYDFITVTKFAEAHWQHLQTPIFGAIMDFYATGQPALLDTPSITDTTILDDDSEVVAMIKELLESRIRPAVQEDGGDIKYVSFEEDTGIVTVKLAGSCVGCPSSSVTLKNGVENMLMHYIPEVRSVISLEEEEEEEGGGDDEDDAEREERRDVGDDDEKKKMKTYQDKLAAAGIPYSD